MQKRPVQYIPSPHYDERPEGQAIEFLILHYTECTLDVALKFLTDPQSPSPVSAHYVIAEDGQIFQLVDEEKRAWHAGPSYWGGVKNLNHCSIGIELVNLGHGKDYHSFPMAQMEALIELCHGIVQRHPIPAQHILGHSDIAPQRKLDPGELFKWEVLADHGLGIDPRKLQTKSKREGVDVKRAVAQLGAIGYEIPSQFNAIQLFNVVWAFQMHFEPTNLTGFLSPQTCRRINKLYKLIHFSL